MSQKAYTKEELDAVLQAFEPFASMAKQPADSEDTMLANLYDYDNTGYYNYHVPVDMLQAGAAQAAANAAVVGCQHEFVEYVGLFEAYEYCKLCQKKRNA